MSRSNDYEERLLKYIEAYTRSVGVPPTIDDMVLNVKGVTSKSSVHYHLQKMVEAGQLVQKNRKGYYYPTSIDEHEVLVPYYFMKRVIDALEQENKDLANTLSNIITNQ